MTLSKQLVVATAAVNFWLGDAPAQAQHVLTCFTLHNDLANFDRRARAVDRYSKSTFETALEATRRAAGDSGTPCPPSGDTISEQAGCRVTNNYVLQRDAEYYRLRWLHSDPVRRRIIAEMRRNGCPPDPPVTD